MSVIFQIVENLSVLSIKKNQIPKNRVVKMFMWYFPCWSKMLFFFWMAHSCSWHQSCSQHESTSGLSWRVRLVYYKAPHYSRMNTLSFQKSLNFLNLETLWIREWGNIKIAPSLACVCAACWEHKEEILLQSWYPEAWPYSVVGNMCIWMVLLAFQGGGLR